MIELFHHTGSAGAPLVGKWTMSAFHQPLKCLIVKLFCNVCLHFQRQYQFGFDKFRPSTLKRTLITFNRSLFPLLYLANNCISTRLAIIGQCWRPTWVIWKNVPCLLDQFLIDVCLYLWKVYEFEQIIKLHLNHQLLQGLYRCLVIFILPVFLMWIFGHDALYSTYPKILW